MNFKKHQTATKLRGGYYTPPSVARFLLRWVLSTQSKDILEPSCGDGVFIREMRGQHRHKIRLQGIELLATESAKARRRISDQPLLSGTVLTTDFLKWGLKELETVRRFDAVVGNPPYIRYQYLSESDQALAESIFAGFNLNFTKHTNAWVPFVLLSINLLKPGGRLAMVIPAEILHVLHAASLRNHLLSECSRILVIDPNELLFEEALQGTVLLMAERKRTRNERTKGVAIVAAPDNEFLGSDPDELFERAKFAAGEVLNGKWMKLLLTQSQLDVFESARKLRAVKTFKEVASVDVGIVTGANKFFLVNDETVESFGLEKFVSPMFGRSEHCPGIIYDSKQHRKNRAAGLPCNFVEFGDGPAVTLPDGALRYIRLGEADDLPSRYKCRIRSPWYKVPSIYKTEIGMLKRSHNFPRLILNSAGAYTTDTAYRIRAENFPADRLVFAFVNSLTALTAELEGRHYGGGVLELVPSEIERLLLPVLSGDDQDIGALDARVRSGVPPEDLLAGQDDQVLANVGLGPSDRKEIHTAWMHIRGRRHRVLGNSARSDLDDHDQP
jgi:adenine-specific DNA-methyltransferase